MNEMTQQQVNAIHEQQELNHQMRPKRQLRQPTKQTLRQTIAHAADTLAEKNQEIDRLAEQLDRQYWLGVVVGGALAAAMVGAAWLFSP